MKLIEFNLSEIVQAFAGRSENKDAPTVALIKVVIQVIRSAC